MTKKPTHEELNRRLEALEKEVYRLRNTEKALLRNEEKYRTIFESTGTAIIVSDEETTILTVNSEFEKLSGYSKKEIEGKKSWTEFVARDYLEKLKNYHRLRRLDNHIKGLRYFITREGSLPVLRRAMQEPILT